jgi:hypothetical protein
MHEEFVMPRTSRLLATAFALGLAGLLGGCGSMAPSWDPTDMLDFLDTEKKTPGERKPVFPEGVPGITQGVPKELYRGNQQSQTGPEAEAAAAAAASPPPETQPAPPPARRSRTAAKRQPAQPDQVEIAPDDVNVDTPPPRRQAEQPQANPFPAPLPR